MTIGRERTSSSFSSEQTARIRSAVLRSREALWATGEYDPLVFARAFIAHGGVQIPGAAVPAGAGLAAAILEALRGGGEEATDEHVAREAHRARTETRWAQAAAAASTVGFVIALGAHSGENPACQALLARDYGLGAGVVPKEHVVVFPPACYDYTCTPVREDEIEQ